jgi:hypothetical protein
VRDLLVLDVVEGLARVGRVGVGEASLIAGACHLVGATPAEPPRGLPVELAAVFRVGGREPAVRRTARGSAPRTTSTARPGLSHVSRSARARRDGSLLVAAVVAHLRVQDAPRLDGPPPSRAPRRKTCRPQSGHAAAGPIVERALCLHRRAFGQTSIDRPRGLAHTGLVPWPPWLCGRACQENHHKALSAMVRSEGIPAASVAHRPDVIPALFLGGCGCRVAPRPPGHGHFSRTLRDERACGA